MNLIYFVLGNGRSYLKLVKLCIESLARVAYNSDLLFITDMQEAEDVRIRNVHFMRIEKSDLLHTAAAKLRIFEYVDIANYNRIIYCDLDTIWLKSPDILFERLVDDKIYITEEGRWCMAGQSHAGRLISDEEAAIMKRNNVKGLNSGFFAFKSSMLPIIREIYAYFLKNKDKGGRCLEQPFINTYLWRTNLYDTSLNSLIVHDGWHRSCAFDGVLLHFAGDTGRTTSKLMRIVNYMNRYIG